MSIKELIEQKERELEDLKAIRASIKDAVYAFYNEISSVVTEDNHHVCMEKATEGFGRRMWTYQLYNPQRCPVIRDYAKSIIVDAIEEVTGDPALSVDDLGIDEIAEVRSLVQRRLDEWLERYWFRK